MINDGSLEVLKRTALFSGCRDSDLDELKRFTKVVHIDGGTGLFRESEPCSAIYCLVNGLIKLCVHGTKRQEKIVEFIGPGQTFAEAAMFSGQGYPVSAIAIEDSKLISIDAYSFVRYLRHRPDLNWTMLSMMSRRLHQLVGQVKSMSLYSAEQRVANYLMEYYDQDTPETPVANLPTRRAELASALGITAETLCRTIANFRNRGWITTVDSAIVVREPAELQALLQRSRDPRQASTRERDLVVRMNHRRIGT